VGQALVIAGLDVGRLGSLHQDRACATAIRGGHRVAERVAHGIRTRHAQHPKPIGLHPIGSDLDIEVSLIHFHAYTRRVIKGKHMTAAAMAAVMFAALAACAGTATNGADGASNAVVPATPFLIPTSPTLAAPQPVDPVQQPALQPAVQAVSISTASVPGPALFTGPKPTRGKVIYLTFDDGPSTYSPAILDLLKGYNAKATFFVIGGQVGTRGKVVRRERNDGHLVGNHSWNHPDLTRLSSSQVSYQLVRTNRAIRAAGLPQPTCMRPPYGAYNKSVLRVTNQLQLREVMWSIDSRDWTKPGASTIARRVISGARNGSIVLLHDGGGNRSQTVAATRAILRTLGRQGYRFESLPACR